MEKTKRPTITHNATKVKALLFLKMRKDAGYQLTIARDIATATGGSVRSLYVLLERWSRWDLVIRYDDTRPYSYCIDTEGERYLSNIGNWFFSGYYSRKRKRRVLGYRGKVEDLRREILAAANGAFYAYDTARAELFYFKSPFHRAEDFVREPIVDNKQKRWGKEHLLLSKHNSISEAFNAMLRVVGDSWVRPVGQAMVDAELAVWKQNE